GNAHGSLESVLAATTKEVLPDDTYIYQTNRTAYYYKNTISQQRLYVKWKGMEIDAELPGEMYCVGSHSNGIFLTTRKKIYKVSFSPPDHMTVVYVRDKAEGEVFDKLGLCSRVRNGKRYAYRVCDNPDREGVP
ncbi:hypothetical protein PMAYCL1PPCAC_16893, partial [Pristionchus mayeri]